MSVEYLAKSAVLSPCQKYRYTLTRQWESEDGAVETCLFTCLNPSKADHRVDDPSVKRMVGFARAAGCSRLVVVNLFALRATDPADMKAHDRPVGKYNNLYILREASKADVIVCAWGCHGSHRGRDLAVLELLEPYAAKLHCLRVTKGGHPEHPLFLPASCRPIPYEGRHG